MFFFFFAVPQQYCFHQLKMQAGCPRPRNCLTLRGLILLLVTKILLMSCYYSINMRNYGRYTGHDPILPPMKCRNLTDAQMQQLLDFTYKIHRFLDEMGLRHWLMYGSLLGALRGNAPIIWDDDSDFGLDGDGKLLELSKTEFFEKIKSVPGVKQIGDQWSRDNLIQIYDKNSDFKVDLMIFHKYGNTMMRRGWLTWLFYFQYKAYHSFPSRLVEQPLPKSRFRFFNISVPREGNEILKYIYPDDWWKVVKPLGC